MSGGVGVFSDLTGLTWGFLTPLVQQVEREDGWHRLDSSACNESYLNPSNRRVSKACGLKEAILIAGMTSP